MKILLSPIPISRTAFSQFNRLWKRENSSFTLAFFFWRTRPLVSPKCLCKSKSTTLKNSPGKSTGWWPFLSFFQWVSSWSEKSGTSFCSGGMTLMSISTRKLGCSLESAWMRRGKWSERQRSRWPGETSRTQCILLRANRTLVRFAWSPTRVLIECPCLLYAITSSMKSAWICGWILGNSDALCAIAYSDQKSQWTRKKSKEASSLLGI